MYRIAIAIAIGLILAIVSARAQTAARPTGTNCDLASPPASSGEDMNHGEVLRIYPRAKHIGSNYTGCQVLFAPDGKKWSRVSLTVVVDGDPVRVWSPEKSDASASCRYRKGRVVVGDPNACPAPQFLLMKSLPPGCADLIRQAMSKQGTNSFPTECQPE